MDILDLIIILLVVGYAIRGFATGFLRQAGALVGFLLGLALGSVLATFTVQVAATTAGRSLVAVITVLGTAAIMGALAEHLGSKLAQLTHKFHIHIVDEVAGAILSMVAVLVSAWIFASIFVRLPLPTITSQIQNSAILATLDKSLPPVPDVIARVESLITPAGFPRVFAGIEPDPGPPVTGPNADAVNAAAAAGKASTVEIEGVGCGGIVEGTGFVVAPGLVATNAHVVAGISSPTITDSAGEHRGTVVSFDPNLDFALVRTTGLAGPPLRLAAADASRGTVGAVLGYPGGGPFNVQSAAILYQQTAVGRNIYGRGLVRRQIYAIQAVVRPGNSGGPLITPDGTVVGVVFAVSTTDPNVGYALTSTEVRAEAMAASSRSAAVPTGACAEE